MDTAKPRSFSEPSGRVYGRIPSGLGIALAISGIALVLAPLRWHGSSPAWSVLGVVLVAGSVPLFRWAHRLGRLDVQASGDGVLIRGGLRDQRLSWAEIRGFTPGWAPSISPLRASIPVVVAERADGGRVMLNALRVDYGPFRTKDAEARVHRLCEELERCRPSSPPAAVPTGSGGQAQPSPV